MSTYLKDRKGKNNYFIRLGISFMRNDLTNEYILKRIEEKSEIWMESRMISEEQKAELQDFIIPDMKKVMCDENLRLHESKMALEFAREQVLDFLTSYIKNEKPVPEHIAWKVMYMLGYPQSMFKEIWGLDVAYVDDHGDDYTDRCGNCSEFLEPGQKFCHRCGARRGEGQFKPYDTVQYCVYGPKPLQRNYKCTECGNEWSRYTMIDNQRYCPKCGCGDIKMVEEKDNDGI